MCVCFSFLQAKQSSDDQQVCHLQDLHKIGVKVNDVLLARSQRPKEVIQVVKDRDAANVHLHYT
jgi:hypothetical protein